MLLADCVKKDELSFELFRWYNGCKPKKKPTRRILIDIWMAKVFFWEADGKCLGTSAIIQFNLNVLTTFSQNIFVEVFARAIVMLNAKI